MFGCIRPARTHTCHKDRSEVVLALFLKPLLQLQQRWQHIEGGLL